MNGFVFRRLIGIAVVLAMALPMAFSADAASRVLYQRKAWEVRVAEVGGSLTCVAQVRPTQGTTFAVWANGRSPVKLQFYANNWRFNSRRTTVVARIDRRPSWNLRNATLHQNSIFFDLPNGNASARFLREIQQGSTLRLYSSGSRLMASWTLAGSRASINALINCVKAL